MGKQIKIAIITNIPTPYRKAQWEYYSKCNSMDITVFYCSNIEKNRYWDVEPSHGIKEVFLRGFQLGSLHINPGVLKVILQDFDIFFVGGYGYPSVIISIILLKCLRKPWVMIVDGVSPLKLNRNNFVIENIKKLLIRGANAYFANGTVGCELLGKYGVNPKKIFNQYMTVDIDYFMEKDTDSLKFRSLIRAKHDISENSTVIMYSGRLVKHKGVQDLITAVRNLKNKEFDVTLLIVGEGEFKDELMKFSQEIFPETIFTGHVDPKKLYKYYYAADVFVLPTYDDPWGLVVNEAMACGLPIIVTDAAGSSIDLVKDNGIIFKNGDIDELSSAIGYLIEHNVLIRYGKNSRKIIKNWTYENSFYEFLNLVKLFTK